MTEHLTGRVEYSEDRSMTVSVEGPRGRLDAGRTFRSSDCLQLASEAVRRVWGISSFDLDMQHGRPAWLREDEVVRLDPRSLDLDEDPTGTPYGQIVGFLPFGGVMVVRPHAGAGILAPEDVTALQGERVDELLLRTLAERAGRPSRAALS